MTCWNGQVVIEHPNIQDCPTRPAPKVIQHVALSHVAVSSDRRAMWNRLVMTCESPDRGWRYGAPGVGIDPGYYFEGGPNFDHGTWVTFGGREFAEHAWDASIDEQIIVAERVLKAQDWGAWPVCSRKLGFR